MSTTASRFAASLVLVAVLWGGPVFAELSVTVTITGSVDEILPVLQCLKDLGYGAGSAGAPGEAIKLEMHSVAPIGAEAPTGEAPVPAPVFEPTVPPQPELKPEPVLALTNPSVEPANTKPGGTVVVTVAVSDPEHVVDTVAVSLVEWSFDLYDNGARADVQAGDGVWSGVVTIPVLAPPGEHELKIAAYDRNGEPVMAEQAPGGARVPLVATTKVTIR